MTALSPVSLGGVGSASVTDGMPTAFTVQNWEGVRWVTQSTVAENVAVSCWIPFSSNASTPQVRIVVSGSPHSLTRLAELTP